MLFLLQRRIHPRLLNLIWHISVETKNGSGWVTSQLLSDTLNSWFERAHQDGNEKDRLLFESNIIEGRSAHLERNNGLMRTLNSGGVCCLTMNNGRHYVLLLATSGRRYFAFDPWWTKKFSSNSHRVEYEQYCGLVNTVYTREKLAEELENDRNKWVHVIAPLGTVKL